MKQLIIILLITLSGTGPAYSQLITATKTNFNLAEAVIETDSNDFPLVRKAARLLQQDIEAVTGKTIPIQSSPGTAGRHKIIIGSISRSNPIQELAARHGPAFSFIRNKCEAYTLRMIDGNLVIAGSDRRGTAYGVVELSKQIGVSPWYWWADVPVKKQKALYIKPRAMLNDAPGVKYRGIFINDEAPALSNWSNEKSGGFNHAFYEKVFELLVRLKANYLWPAMWGHAFYDDDSLNIRLAEEYGIVTGTSHHEPLMRAHDEWRRYGSGKWNYDSNQAKLKQFWKEGMQRAVNEKIVTIGMRGDGDEPMSPQTATALLERIVDNQRQIIAEVTHQPASKTPQLLALYKEVQDYYDKGMRVPDDVTLLLCDDNWGNIRRLPSLAGKPRAGGYGIYYHFDYVGDPRNYKWINTNPAIRVWEQLHLAWEYKARQIWIVNAGDIKPMEFPVSFFLDYAWNPNLDAKDVQPYTERWCAAQFGADSAKAIAAIIAAYTKYNARRKPELLDAATYSFHYNEWERVTDEYASLAKRAERINAVLPRDYQDAFYQLVLYPVSACANLYKLYYYTALNREAFINRWEEANRYADTVKQLYRNDSLLSLRYHQLGGGKWNHMMDQTHIGYTGWQQPEKQQMPLVNYLPADSILVKEEKSAPPVKRATVPANSKGNVFYQDEQNGVSINASHYTRAINANGVYWKILPDLGRTGSSITTFPVTEKTAQLGPNGPRTEYDFYTYSQEATFTVSAFFSPTLNFLNATGGLQYAISIDDEKPRLISMNGDNQNTGAGVWSTWVADNIIIKKTTHLIGTPGKHTLKFWRVSPGVVLQKLVLDFGTVKESYLGPPETLYNPKNDNNEFQNK
ncbi:MAG: glycosyl hydrolase 115 family protein [Bacteroidota bacterium]